MLYLAVATGRGLLSVLNSIQNFSSFPLCVLTLLNDLYDRRGWKVLINI